MASAIPTRDFTECYQTGKEFQEQYYKFHKTHPGVRRLKKNFKAQIVSFVRANPDLNRASFIGQIRVSCSEKTLKKAAEILKKADVKIADLTRVIEMPAELREVAVKYSQTFTKLEDEADYRQFRAAKKAFKAAVGSQLIVVQSLTSFVQRESEKAGIDPKKIINKIEYWHAKRA